jgi:hypothetical protein
MPTTLTPAAAARQFVQEFVSNNRLDPVVKKTILDTMSIAKASESNTRLKVGILTSTDRFNKAAEYNNKTKSSAVDAEATKIRQAFKAALPFLEGAQATMVKAFLDPKNAKGLSSVIADVKLRIKDVAAPQPNATY